MVKRWIAIEHYRMHLVESWPDSDHKQATLAAIRAALASLGDNGSESCCECTLLRRAA